MGLLSNLTAEARAELEATALKRKTLTDNADAAGAAVAEAVRKAKAGTTALEMAEKAAAIVGKLLAAAAKA